MQIEFQNTFEDFWKAWRAHRRLNWSTERKVGWVFFIFTALCVWFFAIAMQWQDQPRNFFSFWTPLFIGAYFLLALGVRNYQEKRVWRRTGERQVQQRWAISDAGIKRDWGHARSESSWSAIHRYRDEPTLFLLYKSEDSYLVVPKRAFSDPAQLAQFTELLHRHIHGRTQGFPVIAKAEAGKSS